MSIDSINKLSDYCTTVNKETNYWLIRTQGGSLYQPFIQEKVVAIGYNKINTMDILSKDYGDHKNRTSYLKSLVASGYPLHKRPGLISSQIERFFFTIKKGDYIIIPDYSSSEFSVGIVDDDQGFYLKYEDDSDVDNAVIDHGFRKSRKVKWKKKIKRSLINPNLFKLFFSHHTVVKANDYAAEINSMIYNFYKYNDTYHLVFDINKKRVSAINLFAGYHHAFTLANEFLKQYNIEESLSDIELSINLNSPGKADFSKKHAFVLGITGLIIVFITGGGYNFKGLDSTAELSTDGIIKKVSDFLDSSQNRKAKEELIKQLSTLDIEAPSDIIEIWEALEEE